MFIRNLFVFNADKIFISYIPSCDTSKNDIINEIEENNIRKRSKRPSRDTSNDDIYDIHDMNEIQGNNKRKRSTSPYDKTKRQRWTEKEKETVFRTFAIHMENLTLPSL